MKRVFSALGFIFAFTVHASVTLAAATPVIRQLAVVGPNSLRLIYDNAGGNPFRDGDTPFVNVDGQTDPPMHGLGFGPVSSIMLGGAWRATILIPNLGPGQHCFKMWGIDVYGDASDHPSAWSCATIPGNVPPAEMLPALGFFKPPLVMATFPDRLLYLAKDGTSDLDAVRGGFVQLVPTGMDCRPPWRRVSYQNGGWYNLGGAHALGWNDPYWMCWTAQLPTAVKISFPPAPAPPVRR